MKSDPQILSNYIKHQYRNFELMEHFFRNPTGEGKINLIADQFLFPLPPHVLQCLLDGYYSLDEMLVKELLGKKLTNKMRKDLDELSEEMGIHLASSRRQFDNLKRIYKCVEELEGGVIEAIQENYLLSEELAMKYVRIVFMSKNKLETFTNKKRFSLVKAGDFEYCVSAILKYWTASASSIDLDPRFLKDISEVKSIFSTNDPVDELRALMAVSLTNSGQEKILTKSKGHTKQIVRNIFLLGAGLRQEKELKDLFMDIMDKVVDPLKKAKLTAEESGALINSISIAFRNMKSIQEQERDYFAPSVDRLTAALRQCVKRLFVFST